jgi:hypothetical protein
VKFLAATVAMNIPRRALSAQPWQFPVGTFLIDV